MPAYRCIIKTPVFTAGGIETREEYVYAPDDATALHAADLKVRHPSQTVEVWHKDRRVERR